MHRIDHSTNNASLPAPDAAGVEGYFKKGDPGLGVPATVVTADWANAMQEEMAYVILQAGLVLSKTDNTQLRQAIQNMIQSANSAVIITGATFEASVANGEAVRWDSTNSRFDEAIADGTANNQAAGFADVTNGKVYCYGETPALFAGLTPGARYYLSAATAGAITVTPPTDRVQMGVAKSATTMFVDVDPQPTAAITQKFQSAELGIAAATAYTVNHGLGVIPTIMQAVVRCKTAEHGYAVNDEALVENNDGGGGDYPSVWISTTQIGFYTGSALRITDRTSGGPVNITLANWKIVLKAIA